MVIDHLPELDDKAIQYYKNNPEALKNFLAGLNTPVLENEEQQKWFQNWKQKWDTYYAERYNGMKIDWSKIQLPKFSKDMDGMVIVPTSITRNVAFTKLSESFVNNKRKQRKNWKWCDNGLETQYAEKSVYGKTGRRTENDYVVYCRYNKEGDAETKGQLTPAMGQANIKSGSKYMNQLEWMILADFYYWETGNHLDHVGYTLFCEDIDTGGGAGRGRWFRDYARVDLGGQLLGDVGSNDAFRSVIS